MRASKDLILREVAGEHILIPVGQMALKVHGMINLSESAAFLVRQLQNDCTEAVLVELLMQEYDVDQETAVNDVHEFIDQMNEVGILE